MDVRGAPVHVCVSEEDLQLGLCPLLAAGLAALAPGLGEEEAGEGVPGGEAHHHALAAARQAHCSAQGSVLLLELLERTFEKFHSARRRA